jgi:hypothetical protein
MVHTEQILKEAISKLSLNLSGATVLTEAATGHYFVTPVLAALAGAKTIAVASNSPYGTADEAISWVKNQAEKVGVESDISFTKNLTSQDIKKADIITNLGFVRPLNKQFLREVKNTAIISLFCEPWEVRKEDIDLPFCAAQQIPIMGTNEETDSLNVFSNVGPLILKMIAQTDLKVDQNTFLIISADKFGKIIAHTLKKNGAKIILMDPNYPDKEHLDFSTIDSIIIADYTFEAEIIGEQGLFRPEEFKKKPLFQVIHLAGRVDSKLLKKFEINCYPEIDGHSFRMSKTFSFLGIQPVIDLHVAGLKVAEELFNARKKYTNLEAIIQEASNNPLCQRYPFNEY